MIAIGAGRIGSSLAGLAARHGLPYRLIDRTTGWEALDEAPGEPILVCVRNEELKPVIDRVPELRRPDLVFVQNGAIRGLLAEHRLPHATRGVLWLAATARGGEITPGYPTPFCGPHAPYCAAWFHDAGLGGVPVDWARFSLHELSKMVWISAFGALGDAYDEDCGQIAERRPVEVAALADELRVIGRVDMGVDVDLDWLTRRLLDYAEKIPRYRVSVREFPWRNGWFMARAAHWDKATPLHKRLLQQGGHWPA